MKKLLIVESPKKAKEIQEFLEHEYIVKATFGHFKDLPENDIGVDLATYVPVFVIKDAKHRDILTEIKNIIFQNHIDEIIIATDPDREGYSIGFMLFKELENVVDSGKIKRAEFREITKQHIVKQLGQAVNFKNTNMGLYKAFLARRIGDRIIGYILSPKYSRTLKTAMSVGRVQSPAVRLVVEREREIMNFKPVPYYVLEAECMKNNHKFTAVYEKEKIEDKQLAQKIYSEIKDIKTAKVTKVEKKEVKQSPKPPFTTSTLQQAASSNLNFSPEQTMRLAQDLFENGFITYHRTDSVRMSEAAIEEIRQLIHDIYGDAYVPEKPKQYKSKNTQADAHEAIRITNFVPLEQQLELVYQKNLTKDHANLLGLIYRRTLASQMEDAVFDRTIVFLDVKGYTFKVSGSVLVFDGYKAVYVEKDENEQNKENQEQKLPFLSPNDTVDVLKIKNTEKFTEPPPRYTEGTLVKKLESLGIGRPSTYAGIIQTIKTRGYVVVEKGKLKPTEKGFALIDALAKEDDYVIDYNFTKDMEEYLDKIEDNIAGYDWKSFVKTLHAKTGYYVPEQGNKENKENKEKKEYTVKPPSEKQIAFAKSLAEKHNKRIPEKALKSSYEMSKFIDSLLKQEQKGKKGKNKGRK